MTSAEQILLNVGVLSAVLTLTVTAGIFVTVLLGSSRTAAITRLARPSTRRLPTPGARSLRLNCHVAVPATDGTYVGAPIPAQLPPLIFQGTPRPHCSAQQELRASAFQRGPDSGDGSRQ